LSITSPLVPLASNGLFGCAIGRNITITKVIDLQTERVSADAVKRMKQIDNGKERKIGIWFQK
jgi:hypothetical protein